MGPPFEFLSGKAVGYYERMKEKGGNVFIDTLSYEEFMMLGEAGLSRRLA